ncbi:DUF6959 family protein [Streptomyces sp. NPDC002104]
MELIEAELFTDAGNDAVVRLPPRRPPGGADPGWLAVEHPQRGSTNCWTPRECVGSAWH